jgi:hypothetical protein
MINSIEDLPVSVPVKAGEETEYISSLPFVNNVNISVEPHSRLVTYSLREAFGPVVTEPFPEEGTNVSLKSKGIKFNNNSEEDVTVTITVLTPL